MREFKIEGTYEILIKHLDYVNITKLEQNNNSIMLTDKQIDDVIYILQQIKGIKKTRNEFDPT